MLVLTRKTQQKIQIGPNIVVTILQVKGQAVRVGIEAPRDVSVLRTELSEIDPQKREESGSVKSNVSSSVGGSMESTGAVNPLVMAADKLRCRASGVAPAPLSRHLARSGPASRRTMSQPVASLVATAAARTVGC